MYESFFGLTALPFKITPDPAFIYWNAQHRRAASILAFGIEQLVPITVVTGDVGAGKTTLLQQFLEDAPADMTVGLISNYWSGMGGLYQWILNAFDLPAGGSEVEQFRAFQDFVVAEYAAGRRCVLIVDEAQNVADSDLEQLRMLTNINAGKDSLLMLFLVGQPQLRDRLRQPNNNQIAQRVGAAFHLAAMSGVDTQNYVRHRLKVAGASREIFDDAALERVHQVSGGVPRLVNVVCELALVAAYGDEVEAIDATYLDGFLKEAAESGMMAHLPMELNPQAADPAAGTRAMGRAGPGARRFRLVGDPVPEGPSDPPLATPGSNVARSGEPADPEEARIMEALMAPGLARRSDASDAAPQAEADTDTAPTDAEDAPPEAPTAVDAAAYRLDDSDLVDLPEVFDKVAQAGTPAPTPRPEPAQDTAEPEPAGSDAPRATAAGPATGAGSAMRWLSHRRYAVLPVLLAGGLLAAFLLWPEARAPQPQADRAPPRTPAPIAAPDQVQARPDPASAGPPAPLDDPDGAALLERALTGGVTAPLDYARAALRGQTRAAYYLGQLYETGHGVPRDLALARAWYRLAGTDVRGAARRLAELGPPETGDLAAPRPLLGGPLAQGGGELVWTGGTGADAALYVVELAAATDGPVRRLPPQELSALRLDEIGDARVWRVLAVDPSGGRYAASPWHLLGAAPEAVSPEPAPVAPHVTVLLPADISPAQKELATGRLIAAGYRFETRGTQTGGSAAPQISHAYATDAAAAERVAELFGAETAVKLGPAAPRDGAPPLPGEITVTLPAR